MTLIYERKRNGGIGRKRTEEKSKGYNGGLLFDSLTDAHNASVWELRPGVTGCFWVSFKQTVY